MNYILDTNVVSALMKGNAAVVEALAETSKQNVGIPQPVLAELEYGIGRLPTSKRKRNLQARYELIRNELPRVSWTDAVSRAFGSIKTQLEKDGTPLEDFDIAIAAHALAYDATLISTDRKHMLRIRGLRTDSW